MYHRPAMNSFNPGQSAVTIANSSCPASRGRLENRQVYGRGAISSDDNIVRTTDEFDLNLDGSVTVKRFGARLTMPQRFEGKRWYVKNMERGSLPFMRMLGPCDFYLREIESTRSALNDLFQSTIRFVHRELFDCTEFRSIDGRFPGPYVALRSYLKEATDIWQLMMVSFTPDTVLESNRKPSRRRLITLDPTSLSYLNLTGKMLVNVGELMHSEGIDMVLASGRQHAEAASSDLKAISGHLLRVGSVMLAKCFTTTSGKEDCLDKALLEGLNFTAPVARDYACTSKKHSCFVPPLALTNLPFIDVGPRTDLPTTVNFLEQFKKNLVLHFRTAHQAALKLINHGLVAAANALLLYQTATAEHLIGRRFCEESVAKRAMLDETVSTEHELALAVYQMREYEFQHRRAAEDRAQELRRECAAYVTEMQRSLETVILEPYASGHQQELIGYRIRCIDFLKRLCACIQAILANPSYEAADGLYTILAEQRKTFLLAAEARIDPNYHREPMPKVTLELKKTGQGLTTGVVEFDRYLCFSQPTSPPVFCMDPLAS